MRLILDEHDVTMRPGEAAEFDTQLPHWFGPADDELVEILSVHGSHGQRMHVRAAPRRTARRPEHPSAPDRKPPRGVTPENGNKAWRPYLAAGTLPRGPGMNGTPDRARSRCYGGGSASVATTGVRGVGSG